MKEGPGPHESELRLRAAACCGFLVPAAASLWHVLSAGVPPSWDDGAYLTVSFALWDRLAALRLWSFADGFSQALGFKAPLLALLPFPVFAAAGKGFSQAAASNLLALAAASLFAWRIAKRLSSPLGGVLAVWLLNLTPLVYGLSRHFYVETLLTALCAGAFCLLVEGGRPLLLGAVLGLGMLCKLTFPVYMGVPLALLALRRRRPRDLALAALAAVLIASLWYARNLGSALAFARSAGYGASTLATGGWSVGRALSYLGLVAAEGWGWPQALLGLVPPFFFASGLAPEPRWCGPAAAAASIGLGALFAHALEGVPARVRSGAAAAALLLPAAVFFEQTSGIGLLPPRVPRAFTWNGPPEQGGLWAQDKLWGFVAQEAAATPGLKRVVLAVSHRHFNSSTADAYAALHGWPLVFRNYNRYPTSEGALRFIAEFRADYIITLERMPEEGLNAELNKHNPAVVAALRSGALPFRQWAEADLTNGALARIFKRVEPKP
ncbi:MAG: glycosyltransferase family 39 protein [Elusimicrobia bacterium]|nr:glycosyltransferase family 39 protein [Elusimicrobiota bacterium]